MKRISIVVFSIISSLWACDIKPAEEEIANTGAVSFTASFETAANVPALWSSGDKLLVIDTKNNSHRFDMDAGASKVAGEFSGTVSDGSQVKYVVFAHNSNSITYDSSTEGFSMEVPPVYTAKEAGALVTSNQAAVGTLQGNEVELRSICGFIKFTLESNGKTYEQGGKTYELTDLKKVTFTSNDGKPFAGTLHARWPAGSATPAFVDVEDGATSVSFNTRSITSTDGDIYYEAGDYIIPVAPYSYEDVTIMVEDADGNTATAIAHRAIDVQIAAQSNLNTIQWPTVVIEVNLFCSSLAEEKAHVELAVLTTQGLSVDRVNNTTGEKGVGSTPKKTEIPFTESGMEHFMWTNSGVGRWTSKGSIDGQYVMADLCFGYYNTDWNYQSQKWTAGYQESVSWIKFPEYDGVLTKIELYSNHSSVTGALSISTDVDPETGIGNHSVFYTTKITGDYGTFVWDSFPVVDAARGAQYYLCMESGNTWRIRGWKLYYKAFE